MKDLFFKIAAPHESDQSIVAALWQVLEKNYTSPRRHYHTLTHIKTMLHEAFVHEAEVCDWRAFVMAIFYHDAVYNVLRSDNEEKSARLAAKHLAQINFPSPSIATCEALILVTKKHILGANYESSLLIDIDLAILGTEWDTYAEYTRQIRREYSIYPDFVYRPGRRKVLEGFLQRDFIFQTPDFSARLEAKAQQNIRQELSLLH